MKNPNLLEGSSFLGSSLGFEGSSWGLFNSLSTNKPRICPICGQDWHDDNEECGNEV